MDFRNCYEDDAYAASYARLEFPGTYYLAFRDLPELFSRHARGGRALDFGCGTGRSTRFLVRHGFDALGVDISPGMVERARTIDAAGDYRLITDGDLSQFPEASFDLILSAFTFDNVPTRERKVALFGALCRLLRPSGRLINLVSSPEIYWHEWASFSTKDFPENRQAQCGDEVRIVVTALDDHRPAVDVLWPEDAYRDVYAAAGLEVVDVHRPLGRPDEPHAWVSETTTAPWTIYVLGPAAGSHAVD
ncbi:MAG: methyltransferase domain-containing protein [Phycisphaerae bacterium]|jgi:SAM-dependent methyltransferase